MTEILTTVLLVLTGVAAVLRLPLFLVLGFIALLLQIGELTDTDSWWQLTEAFNISDDKLTQDTILVPIPLFCLVGYLLSRSKTPERIINLVNALVGWIPGSMGIVTILACAIFTPFTGASGVTIIALGGILYPILIQEKYSEKYSLGVLTASGSIGLLFFPSLPILLFAVIGNMTLSQVTGVVNNKVDIVEMYMAGILPGILLISIPALYSWFIRRNVPVDKAMLSEARSYLKNNFGKIIAELGAIPLILVLFFLGVIDLIDTAMITLTYYVVLEIVIFQEVKWSEAAEVLKDALILTGGILVIIITAQMFTNTLINMKVVEAIESIFKALPGDSGGAPGEIGMKQVLFLVVLNLILLVVGAIMDVFSAILVVVPLLLPIAVKEFGIDPIHFGIVFLTNLEIGYLTPPVGLNLFIASFRFNKPITALYSAAVPFMLMMIVTLLVLTYVPKISLVLPEAYRAGKAAESKGTAGQGFDELMKNEADQQKASEDAAKAAEPKKKKKK